MTLSEVYSKPIKEVINELELVNVQIHSDNDGNVKAVELKYIEKEPDKTVSKDVAHNPFWEEGEF